MMISTFWRMALLSAASSRPTRAAWMWTFIFPHQEGRTPTHGIQEALSSL